MKQLQPNTSILQRFSTAATSILPKPPPATQNHHENPNWVIIIRDHTDNGNYKQALQAYIQSLRANAKPNNFILSSLLKACATSCSLHNGKGIHAHVIKHGFEENHFLQNSLITMYSKCGSLENAWQVFDSMGENKNQVSWNSMINGLSQNHQHMEVLCLVKGMHSIGSSPSEMALVGALVACSHLQVLEHGKCFHGHLVKCGYMENVFLGNSMIEMYGKCHGIEDANKVFVGMVEKSLVTWNTMIGGYVLNGFHEHVLRLFGELSRVQMLTPNGVILTNVLKCCSLLVKLEHGKEIHGYILRNMPSDLILENSLIVMYCKCGSLESAFRVFVKMEKKDVITWNSIIGGFAMKGFVGKCLELWKQMIGDGFECDDTNMVLLLMACANEGDFVHGQCLHSQVICRGVLSDEMVMSCLLNMYAKCGFMDCSEMVFMEMPKDNVVTWNSLIGGYVKNGLGYEALMAFNEMRRETNVEIDSVTMLAMLQTCAHLGSLKRGGMFHSLIEQKGFVSFVEIQNSLIDMYAKCGSIGDAKRVFEGIENKNVASWSAMISGYGMKGGVEEALRLFEAMIRGSMVKPNHITFVAVLSACSHTGLVDKGLTYFERMTREYAVVPIMEHYVCIVDLLGRCGRLDEAESFIKKMPFAPGPNLWAALLGACRTHNDVRLGELAARNLMALEPENDASYRVLANIYAAAGRWDDVKRVKFLIEKKGIKRIPGCSCIEINNEVYTFLAGS